MKKNVGSLDRMVRIVAAVVFAILYFSGLVTGTAGLILIVLSIVFLLTSLVGTCPLYLIFGLNTCPMKSAKKE